MVSGIGPKTTLQRHGIPVVLNLAGVGQNSWVSGTVLGKAPLD